MKATGIVRRIDELGRVVIPKEIRRTLRIREGDPLEIYTDREGGVIFRKYSPVGELNNLAKDMASTLASTTDLMILVTDMDSILATSGRARRLDGMPLSPIMIEMIQKRYPTCAGREGFEQIFNVDTLSGFLSQFYVQPILVDGQPVGGLWFLSTKEEGVIPAEVKEIAKFAVAFLEKQLNN